MKPPGSETSSRPLAPRGARGLKDAQTGKDRGGGGSTAVGRSSGRPTVKLGSALTASTRATVVGCSSEASGVDRQQLVAMLVAAAHRALTRRRRRGAVRAVFRRRRLDAVRGRGMRRAVLPGMMNAHLPVAQARRIAGERGGHGEELNARQSEEEDGGAQAGSGHDESVYIEADHHHDHPAGLAPTAESCSTLR